MPRRPRLHIADYPHHVIQRGHNRAACFFAEEDYQAYLHWLGDGLQKTGIRLHAYVLMTNHVHLLLTPKAADDIPRLIIALGRRFVQYINKTYRRTGTLWDSRYVAVQTPSPQPSPARGEGARESVACATEAGAASRGSERLRRCKSSLIQTDTYLLRCQRYIELNPAGNSA